ncbi:hypothetical protein DAEQUDRAFT_769124 [Daedalea quercina L-15889]|uniref:F-box domain-containing protein n=1 Tax=Daedalea quercina L-15889 TaxID=1314783 RepID=A0A165M086_9APHY|nr:hypothetical protein DAEQUDRAFT_769124 [Daedalea quercina L-15889]
MRAPGCLYDPGAHRFEDRDLSAIQRTGCIRAFANLRHLQIVANSTQSMVLLVDAVIAPELEDLVLECGAYSDRLLRYSIGNAEKICKVHLVLSSLIYFSGLSRQDRGTQALQRFLALVAPLLEFRSLQELNIDVSGGGRDLDVSDAVSNMLGAWPMLESLHISVLIVSAAVLQAAVRACPRLKHLTALRLSDSGDFTLGMPPAPASGQESENLRGALGRAKSGHPLQELRSYEPLKVAEQAHVLGIARFLCELFPHLRVEQCLGENEESKKQNWLNILEEVAKFQTDQRASMVG